MAEPGDELKNPITGQDLVFRRTTAQTGGELLEVEAAWAPDSAEPVEHFHPRQEERFRVLEGTLTVRLEGDVRELRAGDELVVPAGARHAMWNSGAGRARASWETRPALRTEAFFEAVWGLASAGKVDAKGAPGPLQGAVLMREYRDEFRLASPPAPVQAVAFRVLAPIGRLLGRSAHPGPGGLATGVGR
jgi:quercetin dioxygenase-like cupin family protein